MTHNNFTTEYSCETKGYDWVIKNWESEKNWGLKNRSSNSNVNDIEGETDG